MDWKMRAIRGATTAAANTIESMSEAVRELLDEIEARNHLNPDEIVSVIFTATPDLDAIYPAAIARERPNWDHIPLLDVQQMYVKGSLERCIRVLIHINAPNPHRQIFHCYLRHAKNLRPDISLSSII